MRVEAVEEEWASRAASKASESAAREGLPPTGRLPFFALSPPLTAALIIRTAHPLDVGPDERRDGRQLGVLIRIELAERKHALDAAAPELGARREEAAAGRDRALDVNTLLDAGRAAEGEQRRLGHARGGVRR